MFKKIMAVVLTVVLAVSFAAPALAASQEARVVIGADNTEDQIADVYNYFGINRGDVTELQVTNGEERQYLEGLVPDQKIGNVALSCVYIEPNDGSGIELEVNNINYVTEKMYKAALSTAGVTDAKVKITAYKPVSGTGALAGIYKAYEDMTGTVLSEFAKDTAVEELVVTGELQEALGDVSIDIINDLKGKLKETKNMTDDQIIELIKETADKYEVTLTDDQIQQILELVKKFNELNLDPDTFLNLFQAKQGVENFFTSVGDFFKSIGDFFVNLFGGGK
ncbi:DUF1002 domain-containing protein [Christensenella tenuis]|jgi:uncharacterized protein YpuA (DUF1002 family)|uniref:DUF1002 domain-containing protein n=1 Tax=Christensenella tenuis TaxID=2763033 RepID=A0ABR7EB49_9FIRM|nr:DUF1002 domain-containing protein [Christensenella tenuis]MBC5647006.1 DUF1002 domain-containing protein [Christensenella tenuis]